ncbi:kinase-like domain-containing protein [Amylostereum chailletii]|nr:kinase-like domain-containing protein [Amylostereum chailletii]
MSESIPPPNHSGVRLQHGRFTLADLTGVGSRSTVWAVKCRKRRDRSNTPYAMKVLHPVSVFVGYFEQKRQALEVAFYQEACIHTLVQDHPNILTLHGSFSEDGYHCFLFDLCRGGTLADLIRTPFFWKRDDRTKLVLTQLIGALQHCHSYGIAHRDLKPENILVSPDRQHIYLSDFGLASKEPSCTDFGVGKCYGEDCSHQPYNPRVSDVWSLGILLLEMLVGCELWSAPSRTEDKYYAQYLQNRDKILRGGLPLTSNASALISRILEPVPELRISLAELLQELEHAGALTLKEDELACASSTTRKAYIWHAQELGVPYNVPAPYTDPFRSPYDYTVPLRRPSLSQSASSSSLSSSTSTIIAPLCSSPVASSSPFLPRPSSPPRPPPRRYGSNLPSIYEVFTETEGLARPPHAPSHKPSSSVSSTSTATSFQSSRPSTSTSITAPSSFSDPSSVSKPLPPPASKRPSRLVRAMDIVGWARDVQA